VGRWIIRVRPAPEWTKLAHTVAIVNAFDATVPVKHSACPATAVQRAGASHFEHFAGEDLFRATMHHRWDFDDSSVAFLSMDRRGSRPWGDNTTRLAVVAFASQ
jgi:hypothetical protein